jgi:hypothetical protein
VHRLTRFAAVSFVGAAGALLLLAAARRARPPETRIVVVTAPPAPPVPVVVVEPTVTPVVQTAEFSFPIAEPTGPPPAPATALDAGPPPPYPPPVPETLREQLGRCVVFRTERFNPGYLVPLSVFTQVRATNICNTSFSGRDVWIEVRVYHIEGGRSGVAGSKITRFQGLDKDGRYTVDIPARGIADLVVQIDGLDQSPMYRFETTLSSQDDEGRPAP